jgi:CubicO group peptidase (beta-lactamase class C family)
MWTVLRRTLATALLGVVAAAGIAAAPTPSQSPASAPPALAPANGKIVAGLPPVSADGAHMLTKADADAWLDGYFPYALAQGDLAGATVVIVKDGQVLTQRGYGYADIAKRKKIDPATTLFRAGSISKLFTWTAVMQLVEQGKIDLDADVNTYLDFKIPPRNGKPITMRDIMTHTPGFEEATKGGIRYSGTVAPLGEVLKRMLPARVFAAGSTPAYSNYATGLAGYIVERISGMPYEEYIERNIFQRLGMAHSTFRQPLPANLAPFMATGYPRASGDAKPFELISVPPAGSLSISAADMAKFMIAYLNQGAPLVRPETAQLMRAPATNLIPALNRMSLGFYEQRINDQVGIGHGGDLILFHSYMWIIPSQNVGIYVSMNSGGSGAANFALRLALFEQFGDRYFPRANDNAPVELATAKDHAKMLVGSYVSSRGFFTNFADIANFIGQTEIGLDKDGRPLVPDLLGRAPRKWIEIAPFVWEDTNGHQRLAATVENGKVVRWSVDAVSPFMVWDRLPWYRQASWLMPLLLVALGIVLISALSWPLAAIDRRRHGLARTRSGRDLTAYRLVRVFSWLVLVALGGWMLVLQSLFSSEANLDWLLWLMEIGGTIAFFGLLGSALWIIWRDRTVSRRWTAKLWSVLLVLAAFVILWVALVFHLISFGTNY